MYNYEEGQLEQQKLFYNVCNDLWSFAKTLNKNKSEMTDEDWTAAVELLEKTAQKYKSLGNNEYDLAYSSMMGILDYIEKGER